MTQAKEKDFWKIQQVDFRLVKSPGSLMDSGAAEEVLPSLCHLSRCIGAAVWFRNAIVVCGLKAGIQSSVTGTGVPGSGLAWALLASESQ